MFPIQKNNYVEIMMVIYDKLAFSATKKYLLLLGESTLKEPMFSRQLRSMFNCQSS